MTVTEPLHARRISLAGRIEQSLLLGQIPWLRHGITTRVPGLGKADGNVGYTAPRDPDDAWDMRQQWARAIGIEPGDLVRVRQVHGAEVRLVTSADTERGTHPDADQAPIADAMITNEPRVALMTLHADCLAMLLVDPVRKAVAAVHAGWRSTVQNIAGQTVREMERAFGTNPVDLLAYVGPSIGAARYEVGYEVIDAWRTTARASDVPIQKIAGRWHFDLKVANAGQLTALGVPEQNLEISPVCTASNPDRWFSHRRQGPLTGRFAAIIAIAGGDV